MQAEIRRLQEALEKRLIEKIPALGTLNLQRADLQEEYDHVRGKQLKLRAKKQKDLKKKEGGWYFSQIGAGVIGYPTIFKELIANNALLPLSIEQLFIFEASEDFTVYRKPHPQPLSYINKNLQNSIAFVKSLVA